MKYALLLAFALAGCASGKPYIIEGSPHQVSVSRANMTGSAGMLQTADAHCAKYGKHAEFVGDAQSFTWHYRCVPN